jgi:L-aspartate oxidase
MSRYSPQNELAPRDVVARAILSEMLAEGTDCQYLDLRHLPAEKMHARFPTISAICRQYGLDLARDLLPVAPAAHYCMGGVMVDTCGHTTLPELYAVGEVACTGVHGANRLASNSLLEGLVYGIRIADELAQTTHRSERGIVRKNTITFPYTSSLTQSVVSSGTVDNLTSEQVRGQVRQLMWQYVSLCRDEEGLLQAAARLQALYAQTYDQVEIGSWHTETMNMLQVAELVIVAALERRESRGSHWRTDYQTSDPQQAGRHYAFQRLPVDPFGFLEPEKEATHYA